MIIKSAIKYLPANFSSNPGSVWNDSEEKVELPSSCADIGMSSIIGLVNDVGYNRIKKRSQNEIELQGMWFTVCERVNNSGPIWWWCQILSLVSFVFKSEEYWSVVDTSHCGTELLYRSSKLRDSTPLEITILQLNNSERWRFCNGSLHFCLPIHLRKYCLWRDTSKFSQFEFNSMPFKFKVSDMIS